MTTTQKIESRPRCPYCGDDRLRYNPRPIGRHDEGDLFGCVGCGAGGESVELDEIAAWNEEDRLAEEQDRHEPEDLCPAGGEHDYKRMTAWEMGSIPPWPRPTGVYCEECGAPAPKEEN